MRPENVRTKSFRTKNLLYQNNHFSIAYGSLEDNKEVMAMRWNGDINNNDDIGFPQTFGNPVWFIIDSHLTIVFLKAILGEENANNKEIITILNNQLNN